MRKILVLISLFLMVGCGVLDKKSLNNEQLLADSERVNFSDTTGNYDFSEYLFPNKSQTNKYELVVEKKDTNGEIVSDYTKMEHDYYVSIDHDQMNLGDDITYIINEDRIIKKAFIDNSEINNEYKRYLNEGDSYYTFARIDAEDSYRQGGKLVCQMREHNSTMNVVNKKYDDVLHLECIGEFYDETNGFSKDEKFTIQSFYAKNIGLIKQVTQEYESTTYGSTNLTFYTNIIKSIQEIQE